MTPAAAPRVAGVVLAAGEGTRFAGAGSKLLAPLGGRPLVLAAIASACDARLDAVVVVTGAVALSEVLERLPEPVFVVDNPDWRSGQASSLRAGVAWCEARGCEAAVVGLGDQPLVPASAWRAVAEATGAPIVTASFAGRRRPPVRLHRSIWPLLPFEGDEGARELMRRRPDLVDEVACEGDPHDVDTLEDLRRIDAGGECVPRTAGEGHT